MKAASKYILKYFVVGVVTCLSLLFLSYPVKAETSDNFAGHWYVWEENVNVSGNQWISYQNVLFVTNDPSAMGQVQVNNTTSGPNNFVQTLDFSGTYTFYSHLFEQPFTLSNGLMPSATSNGRAFTTYTPIQSSSNIEVVQLSSTQINSLINAISSSSSYDDTNLLNSLAIINGVLDNIDTSTTSTASDIAALNTTATSILSALNNLDNALDSISWIQILNSDLQYSDSLTGEVITLSENTDIGKSLFVILPNMTSVRNTDSIVHIKIPVNTTLNQSPIIKQIYLCSNSSGYANVKWEFPYYYTSSRQCIDLYIYDVRYYLASPLRLFIEFDKTLRAYYSASIKFNVSYISNTDIEYWQLKSFFLQASSQQSDTSYIDNENENLSDHVDDYIQQEDQLIGGFDNAMTNPALIPTSNPDANLGSWGSNFISSLSLFSVLVGNVVGTSLTQWGNPIYLLLNFSLVFGFALLIIGKRG